MAEHDAEQSGAMDYKQTLAYSQDIRKRIVDEFVGDGRVPNDPKELNVVLKALGDMDKTALMDRKNEIDQGNADSSKQVAEAMSEFILMQQNRNPFQRSSDGALIEQVPNGNTVTPEVDVEKLGNYELVAGEDEIGVITESYKEFMARMEKEKEDNPIPDD